MRRNGVLPVLLSLFLALGATSAATAGPRHARHHAKAMSAEKGGNSDFGRSQGSDKSGSGGSQGNGNSGNGNGGGPDQPKGNSGQGNGGPGASSPGKSEEKGSGGATDPDRGGAAAPGRSGDAGPGASGPGASLEVPAAILAAPDIALESLPAELQPSVASDVLVAPQAGQVLVQDGDGGFAPMDGPGRVPVGAFVDARQGVVALVDKLPDGTTQTAVFTGSKFQVRQTGDGGTALVLRGSSFRDVCGKVTPSARDGGPGARVPRAGAARARSKKVVRSLWASDHKGKFQTYGRNSVATVRGTVWQTVDRCDGTLIRVAEGEVVVHDRRTHRDVVVTAGHSYLARDPEA